MSLSEVRGQLEGDASLLLPRGSPRSNSGPQAWQPLSEEWSGQPQFSGLSRALRYFAALL